MNHCASFRGHGDRRPTAAARWIAALAAISSLPASGQVSTSAAPPFAIELAAQGDHSGAAVEFRRRAMEATDAAERAGLSWAAAYEHWKAAQYESAERMLDRAEDARPDVAAEARLLRGETAVEAGKWEEAAFYYRALAERPSTNDLRAFSARRLALARLREGDVPGAADALRLSPREEAKGVEALQRYGCGHDKTPWIGGALGIVPGLGYVYAGEYANALRSILLNALFGYGMIETADDEQWAAFAVIAFVEFTWYTGSIYGGIDATHRFNERRLDACAADVMGGAEFSPAFDRLPLVVVRFRF